MQKDSYSKSTPFKCEAVFYQGTSKVWIKNKDVVVNHNVQKKNEYFEDESHNSDPPNIKRT